MKAKDMDKNLEVSSNTNRNKDLENIVISSLEEITFTERIEDLILLRQSEKKSLSSKSTGFISKYLEGLNYNF